MRTIWKYPLTIDDVQYLDLSESAQVLSVQMQGEALCLWALVDLEDTRRVRHRIRIYGTGHAVDDASGLFLGTVQLRGGALVLHVFDVVPSPAAEGHDGR